MSDKDPHNPELIKYAKIVLSENSPIEKQLSTKGAVGEYLMEIKRGWAKEFYNNAQQ